MATKLNPTTAKQLKKIGINVKTEEEARKKLLLALKKEGIEGMEDEDTENLIAMVESFVAEVEETEEDDEAENEEVEDTTDTESADIEALAEEMANEEEEDEVEDEEEQKEVDEKPKKEVVKQSKPKAKEKKEKVNRAPKNTNRLNPKDVEEDRKEFEPFLNLFGDKFIHTWISLHGVCIKYNGVNCKRVVATFENVSRKEGNIIGDVHLPSFVKKIDLLDESFIEYKIGQNNVPIIKAIPRSEAVEMCEKLLPEMESWGSIIDSRLGNNRHKMEKTLEEKPKKKSKK